MNAGVNYSIENHTYNTFDWNWRWTIVYKQFVVSKTFFFFRFAFIIIFQTRRMRSQ